MKDSVILSVENVSKQYRLGEIGTGTLSHDLKRWWYRMRGKEDPFLKIGEKNDRSKKAGGSDYVWALQDISFEVKRGEVLGIIGKNGAGKSTLLKILSKVTSPTTGKICSKGRIASLLEVGTGFHPELTGRENVFLNGAILGMSKKEIASKLDEIVAFSGCERYIDTPVKRYSSGMTVRLAFAVAAFLEPEILIVDEVLAVGDAEFQRKALGKMQDISKGEGRTVLFVSHSMAAVRSLCSRGLLLENGTVRKSGNIQQVIDAYMDTSATSATIKREMDNITLNHFELTESGRIVDVIGAFEPFEIRIDVSYRNFIPVQTFFEIFVKDQMGTTVTTLSSWLNSTHMEARQKRMVVSCKAPGGFSLMEGVYTFDLNIADSIPQLFQSVWQVNIMNTPTTGYTKPVSQKRFGGTYTPNFWKQEE